MVMVGVFCPAAACTLTMLTSVTPVDLSFLLTYVPEFKIYVRKYVIECDSYASCAALALWSEYLFMSLSIYSKRKLALY